MAETKLAKCPACAETLRKAGKSDEDAVMKCRVIKKLDTTQVVAWHLRCPKCGKRFWTFSQGIDRQAGD